MKPTRFALGAISLTSILFSSQAHALASFGSTLDAIYTGKNLYNGSCTVCHQTTNDDPAWFSRYGKILRKHGANDDNPISPMINAAGPIDYDNDGFTVNQEIYGGSFAAGTLASNPTLAFTGSLAGTAGKAFGLSTPPATLDALSSALNNSSYINLPANHKNIVSGILEYTLGNVTSGSGEAKLMFNTGGIQTNPTVQFIDTYSGTATVIPATGNINGSWVVNNDGSISVTIADDGVFDLYSNAIGSTFYDPYAAPSIIQTRLAITTAAPATGIVSGGSGGEAVGTAPADGSLHCVTSGLGTQGLMLLGLLTTAYLVRRKVT